MFFKQCNNGNYKKGRTQRIEYIVIHYTANNGDTARNNLNYFANNICKSSAHYFIDENEICQSVKDNDIAYHCGANKYIHSYCRNSNSIGIEMCSRKNSLGKYYIKDETIKNTVKLVKELMKKYNIPLGNVIRHYDVTGKKCPLPMVENIKLWGDFKNMLKEENNNKCSCAEFEEAKNYLVKLGITDGSNPQEKITREQVWTMIYRLCKK